MKMKIDHIGVVVNDVNYAVGIFQRLLRLQTVPVQDYQKNGVYYKIAFISVGGITFELIEPFNQRGMAQEHLDKFGPGVYHFALQVPDLAEAIKQCRIQGFETQDVRIGAGGGQVTFLKDPVLPGIYVEFVEPKRS